MTRRALVLGGGGITGIAWELGILAGLAAAGVDLRGADLVVGTSAGSVVGAQISSGTDLEELYGDQLAPPGNEQPARMGVVTLLRWARAIAGSRHPRHARARIGRMALGTGTAAQTAALAAQRRAVIESRLRAYTWPEQPLLITAVDAESGEFAAFSRSSRVGEHPVTLVDAVAASCAVPGVWPPITIGGRRWIDGGVRSATNADLAVGHQQVVVLAPVTRGIGPSTGAAARVAALGHRTQAVLVAPDSAARTAIGRNVLDPARRAAAARAGRVQSEALVDKVARIWAT
ncbi:MAG: patatin-like phospholipase family protein [Pseudonocardiaceae bacterium]